MYRTKFARTLATAFAIVAIGAVNVAPAMAAPSQTRLTIVTRLVSDGARTTTLDGGQVFGTNHLTSSTIIGGVPATVDVFALVNYKYGTGPFTFATTFLMPNGSSLAVWCEGKSVKDAKGSSHFSGPLSVIGGTGDYSGATGKGSMTGFRKGTLGSAVELTYRLVLKTP